MAKQRIEFRFGAGQPDGRHSRTWRLWLSGSEVYFAVRTASDIYKVSLHFQRDPSVPPEYQLSLTHEFLQDHPRDRGLPKNTRHLAKWTHSRPDAKGPYVAAKLLLPEIGLERVKLHPSKPVTWLGDPAEGYTIELRFLFSPRNATSVELANPSATKVVDWTLANEDTFAVLVYNRPLSDKEISAISEFRRRVFKAPVTWQSAAIDWKSSNLGLLLHGPDNQDIYTLIDLSLATPIPPAA